MTLLLYPGYHKTGTTLMQTRVLPEMGVNYIGRRYREEHDFQPPYGREIEGHLAELAQGRTRVPALGAFLEGLVQDETVHVLATENLLRPASTPHFLKAVEMAAAKAPGGRLQLLLTVRRQFDLMVSRYLHDLNTKYPSFRRPSVVSRVVRRFRRGRPPYSLCSALAESNPACHWPFCQGARGECPCSQNSQTVSITPSFYDFHALYNELGKVIPKEDVVVADLVDPELRTKGIERLCTLLSRLGVEASPGALATHFETPVNARHGLTKVGFSRDDLQESELSEVKEATREMFRASNQRLADVFPEFSVYLEAW